MHELPVHKRIGMANEYDKTFELISNKRNANKNNK